MRVFAAELSDVVHNTLALDTIAVKIASVDGSLEAQNLKSQVSGEIYTVIEKTAADKSLTVVELVEKVAEELKKPALDPEYRTKLAAAVLVDSSLTRVISESTPDEAMKLASSRAYGREFFVELLAKVI
jgi:hypothetical protein